MNVRILKPHRKTCRGLENVRDGKWDSAWWVTAEVVWRGNDGTKRGSSRMWFVAQCNVETIEPCGARALISERWLSQQVQEAG